MIEMARALRLACLVAIALCFAGSHAWSAPHQLTDVMERCLDFVQSGQFENHGALALEPTPSGNGQTAELAFPEGEATLTFAADIPQLDRFCGIFGFERTADTPTITWGRVERIVAAWHARLLASGGFTDATNPAGPGVGAMRGKGAPPFIWVEAQPVWPGYRPLGSARENLPPDLAAFRFQSHGLDRESCAKTQALVNTFEGAS